MALNNLESIKKTIFSLLFFPLLTTLGAILVGNFSMAIALTKIDIAIFVIVLALFIFINIGLNLGLSILLLWVILSIVSIMPIESSNELLLIILLVISYYYNKNYKIKNLINYFDFKICIILSLIIMPYYSVGYSQLNIWQMLLNKQIYIDTLYHVSISSLWKNSHVISHGIHGLNNLEYHAGSHIIYAGMSKLANISSMDAYGLLTSLFFIPLLSIMAVNIFNIKLESIIEIRVKYIGYLCLIAGTGIFLGNSVINNFAVWASIYGSESFVLSIILLYALINYLENSQPSLLESGVNLILSLLFLAAITYTKISTGFAAIVIIGSYILFNGKKINYQFLFKLFLAGIIYLVAYLSIAMIINPTRSDSHYSPHEFIQSYVVLNANLWLKYGLFFIVHFSYILVGYILYIIFSYNKNLNFIVKKYYIFSSFIIIITGMAFISIMYIEGGSNAYFSYVAFYLAIPIIINSIPYLGKNLRGKIAIKLIATLIILMSIFYIPKTLIPSTINYLNEIRKFKIDNDFSYYINKLKLVRDDKVSDVVFISRDELNFWGWLDCRAMPFVISSISEKPALYAWPSNDCYSYLCGARFTSNGLCKTSGLAKSDIELKAEAYKMNFTMIAIIDANGIRYLRAE